MSLEQNNLKPWRGVCTLIAVFFGLYFGAMAITQGVSLLGQVTATVQTLGLTVLTGLGVWELNRRALEWKALYRRALWILGGLALLWGQWFFAFAIYGEYGWDVAYCLECGMNLADVGEGVHYLSVYPNNMLLSLLYGHTFWWIQDMGFYDYMLPLVYLNLVVIDLAVVAGAALARRTLGRGGMGAFLLLAVPFVVFCPWIGVPYSDTLSMLCPILILYLWDRARQARLTRALGLWALMGLCAGVGFVVKPTAVIALIAVGGLGFFLLKKDGRMWLKHILGIALALCMVVGISQGLYLYCYSLAPAELNHETIENNSVPMSHFFMMGLNELEGRYGAWRQEDVSFNEGIPGKDAKTAANMQEAARRIQEMGVGGYLDFLWKKSQYTWNDGTFCYGGEGNFCEVYLNDTPMGVAIQSLVVPGREANVLYRAWANGLWFVMLALAALGVLKKGQAPGLWAVRLTVLGLALFQLLFETRARYLVNHLPVITLAAASGLQTLRAWRKKA